MLHEDTTKQQHPNKDLESRFENLTKSHDYNGRVRGVSYLKTFLLWLIFYLNLNFFNTQ